MRSAALILRRLKPDIAGLIEAGLLMDSADMTLDSSLLRSRHPGILCTTLQVVVRRQYGELATPRPPTARARR